MIVRMKKITVVALESDQAATLAALGRLGVLHLVAVREPAGPDLEKTSQELARARSALYKLDAVRSKQKPDAGKTVPHHDGIDVVRQIESLLARRKELEEREQTLIEEKAAIDPLGDFDPAQVRELGHQGITLRLYRTADRRKPIAASEGAVIVILREDDGGRYFAVIGCGDVRAEAVEIPLPARRLADVKRELEAVKAEMAAVDRRIIELSHAADAVAALVERLEARLAFLLAREGAGRQGALIWLQGFCPVDAVEAVRRAAHQHGWGLLVEEPSPGDQVPTLIRNPAWIRPIEPLFKVLKILPGYHEVDVSWSFLIFLSVFFAMIVGDAGYGLVFLGLTAWARRKWKTAAPEPFRLLTLFSVTTITWGILSGAYFGLEPLPAPLAALQARLPTTAWLADKQNTMSLCLFIGSVHLTLAHLWNALRMLNSSRAIAQLGWVGMVWSLFFAARFLMFGTPLPDGYRWMLMASLAAIVLFMTPVRQLKREWANHLMLLLSIMSTFGDVLSYTRLYALGVAGFKVAAAFNTMAAGLASNRIWLAPVAALLLFAMHGFNILLSAMSVLVHGIRLNALEFSMHLGLEWSGKPYRPFVVTETESSNS